MPSDSEGSSGLNPSCVSAGGASRESSGLNECCAEDYASMQEAASTFSTRNELIAFNFSFLFVGFGFFLSLEICKLREFPQPQRLGNSFYVGTLVMTFDLAGQPHLMLTFCKGKIQTYNEATMH